MQQPLSHMCSLHHSFLPLAPQGTSRGIASHAPLLAPKGAHLDMNARSAISVHQEKRSEGNVKSRSITITSSAIGCCGLLLIKEFQPESVLLGQNGRPAKCLSSQMPTFRLEQGQQYVLHLCLRRCLVDGKNRFPSMVMLFSRKFHEQ